MKKSIFSRFIAGVLALSMCFVLNATAFAAEVEENGSEVVITNNTGIEPLADGTLIRSDSHTFNYKCTYRMTAVRENWSGTIRAKIVGNPGVYYTVTVTLPSGASDSKTILANGTLTKILYYIHEGQGPYRFDVTCNDIDNTSVTAYFYIYD